MATYFRPHRLEPDQHSLGGYAFLMCFPRDGQQRVAERSLVGLRRVGVIQRELDGIAEVHHRRGGDSRDPHVTV